jgi:uncharacterized membrane protein HdeD (DUF308 family)
MFMELKGTRGVSSIGGGGASAPIECHGKGDNSMAQGASGSMSDVPTSFAAGWRWLLGLGVLWAILGLLALVLPFAAALAVELVVGVVLAVGGIGQLVQAFRSRSWPGFALQALSGALAVLVGGLLVLFPVQGILFLTLILSAFFIASGILKIITALQNRALAQWGWLLVSGILSLIVGALIFLGWPASAVWAIGLLVGIELTFTGIAMIMLALSFRNGPRQ